MGSAYLVAFLTDDAPAMRSLYEQMRALGMTTTGDGRTGICEKYDVDRDRRTDTDAKPALNLLSDADEATLYFWTPSDAELRVSTFNLDSADWTVAKTTIGFQTTVLDPCVQDEATVKTRVDEIFEAAVSIATVTEPAFAWSAITDENEQYERVKPSARPISDHVDDLSWLTVMSPRSSSSSVDVNTSSTRLHTESGNWIPATSSCYSKTIRTSQPSVSLGSAICLGNKFNVVSRNRDEMDIVTPTENPRSNDVISKAIEDADFADGFDPDSDLRFVSPDETSTIG